MKIARRTLAESALVLAVGAVLATSGGATAALSLVGHETAPVQASSLPVAGSSAPDRCVDVAVPGAAVSVGSASAPAGCVVVDVPGPVGASSLPVGLPVGAASAPVAQSSAPRCVSVMTPVGEVRSGC